MVSVFTPLGELIGFNSFIKVKKAAIRVCPLSSKTTTATSLHHEQCLQDEGRPVLPPTFYSVPLVAMRLALQA
jgi:hypothetical protein